MEKKKLSLYQIGIEFDKIDQTLEQLGGEITPEIELEIERLDSLLLHKTDGCCSYIDSQKDLIKLADEKIKALQEFKTARKNGLERFNNYIIDAMKRLKKEEIIGDFETIKFRKQTKQLKINDENKIPPQFTTVETTVKIDKKKILTDLKKDIEISGCEIILSKQSLNFSKRKI